MSKNKQQLSYKNYLGSVNFDLEEYIIYGEIMFINDLVTYEATSITQLKNEFELAVDDYIDTCKTLNREPQKSFSGSLNIRIGAKLHKKVAMEAHLSGISLNEFIKKSVDDKLSDKFMVKHHFHHHDYMNSNSADITIDIPYNLYVAEEKWQYN
ncbi:MAG: type II toxin-antitoxin system HicB family antitoxin [Methylococcales symbiont of Hymedesmia sp. n. MRB-2018]|nr:MAG: type II toxin-antitoxin system HicB family antitoxin [Methylococcales symbiont of Hymedesmia sp. n. MRB-2018]